MALLKRIIPCLDIKNGLVVKGQKFDSLITLGDPVSLAKKYEDEGADELVLLDISASLENRKAIREIVLEVAKVLTIPFTVGGGIHQLADITALLEAGADKVSINSSAVQNPNLIDEVASYFGSQCIVIAIDYLSSGSSDNVFIHGGTKQTNKNVIDWANEVTQRGAGELLLTCIDRDGTGAGFEQNIIKQLSNKLTIPIVASGGAKKEKDFIDIFKAGADGALAAGIFHRNEIKIQQIKTLMKQMDIPVRISKEVKDVNP
ncbi:imidazole glycerol phosphate synthase subunit HisF [Pigmentibacter ruber]|uniref:imidazole glycerol phosphate synthase subunit HisF n=1 Tax=Pigmentibacter ruber TaxID=2683196 RepID=UPI00131B43EF|nr:imidazole glycerol phosphate synthase subunit HisF [Pigmentibacter ruber]BFD32973.1 imidazole glycerol phosphate synthase subunit HisF [Pigmentibacter ruber]